jgi:ADP-heptose:LPS heptosyltransferase
LNYELLEAVFPALERHEPRLTVTREQLELAARTLHEIDRPSSGYVIVHPLSAGSAPNWSLSRYLDLADRLAAAGHIILLTGSAVEAKMIDSAQRSRSRLHASLAGKTDLPTYVGLVKSARAVITGSTGPIHIATAVQTPAVGIYPPQQAISPARWGPRGGPNKLFTPCVKEVGQDQGDPMDRISVDEVAEYLLAKLADKGNIVWN